MTVLEGLLLTTEYLEKKGIESARLNAELMLAHILKCKRLELYLAFDRPLSSAEVDEYRQFLKRRSSFEPLQYILGEVEFYGLRFLVNRSVLIPRPETEIMVETLLSRYKKEEPLRILDIGTGSGSIAVSLSRLLPNSNVTAVDISQDALEVAAKNAEINGTMGRMEFLLADILDENSLKGREFDLIVSNPPYVALDEYKTLQPEIVKYEPHTALTDNADGFKFYEAISRRAPQMLPAKGALCFELGQHQWQRVEEIMKNSGFAGIEVTKDLSGIERVIYGVLS